MENIISLWIIAACALTFGAMGKLVAQRRDAQLPLRARCTNHLGITAASALVGALIGGMAMIIVRGPW